MCAAHLSGRSPGSSASAAACLESGAFEFVDISSWTWFSWVARRPQDEPLPLQWFDHIALPPHARPRFRHICPPGPCHRGPGSAGGCSSIRQRSPRLCRHGHPDMEMVQGNFIARADRALQARHDRLQVRDILGTPLLASVFPQPTAGNTCSRSSAGVKPRRASSPCSSR